MIQEAEALSKLKRTTFTTVNSEKNGSNIFDWEKSLVRKSTNKEHCIILRD